MSTEKTHWLQSPNKNYLGHWDLPEGRDLVLTIKNAQWEEVKNPITRTAEAKRVVRFVEKGIKPFICNETNAQTILKSTGTKFMEDAKGFKIKLGLSQTKVAGQMVDCLRVREINQEDLEALNDKIKPEQVTILETMLDAAKMDKVEFCELMKLDCIANLPSSKLDNVLKRLQEKAKKVKGESTNN